MCWIKTAHVYDEWMKDRDNKGSSFYYYCKSQSDVNYRNNQTEAEGLAGGPRDNGRDDCQG